MRICGCLIRWWFCQVFWGVHMGVLACDRGGCDKVMCDRMSADGRWYLCSECFAELVSLGVDVDIDEFMSGPPNCGWDPPDSLAYWDKRFPLAWKRSAAP